MGRPLCWDQPTKAYSTSNLNPRIPGKCNDMWQQHDWSFKTTEPRLINDGPIHTIIPSSLWHQTSGVHPTDPTDQTASDDALSTETSPGAPADWRRFPFRFNLLASFPFPVATSTSKDYEY